MLEHIRAAIFDLDGVIVDTAKYHYLAWKRMAAQLGIDFTPEQNEHLKGVSRAQSLELILGFGGMVQAELDREALMEQKNAWYLEMVDAMDAREILDGVVEFLDRLSSRGVLTALGSASKNARRILSRVGLANRFDAIIDGTKAHRTKPDPMVFLLGAEELGVDPADCVVFEDAAAGVAAARAAGMRVIGIGKPSDLADADAVIPGIATLVWDRAAGSGTR